MIDLKITSDEKGIYDLTIVAGRFESVDSFDTSIVMSYFGEVRAASSEVSSAQDQRGWWGNLFNLDPYYEYGSKLWLIYQSRCLVETLNLGIGYLEDSFEWYVQDGYATQVNVTGEIIENNIRFYITIFPNDNEPIHRAFNLWRKTGE